MEPGTPGFGGGGGSSLPPPLQPLEVHITKWQRKYQQTLDKLTPHVYQRWAGTAGLIGLFLLRIVLSQGVSDFLHQFSPSGALTPSFTSGISVSSHELDFLDNVLNDGRVFVLFGDSLLYVHSTIPRSPRLLIQRCQTLMLSTS